MYQQAVAAAVASQIQKIHMEISYEKEGEKNKHRHTCVIEEV